jgi:CheY-like chemotaxis protein
MDIRMPVMTGMEATRRIKATEAGARVKIIALTAHALEDERREILDAGCDDFIRKPYRESEIYDAMARHLDMKYEYKAELRQDRITGLAAGQPRYRLLVAEDQRESRLLLRKLLEPLGCELREAVNGQEAADIFSEWQPHLIWMDIRMPIMSGIEATRRIRATEAGGRVKIIALTAHALEEERKEILDAGCDDFIRKPYRESEIYDAMTRHLGMKYEYSYEEGQAAPAGSECDPSPEQLAALPAELFASLRQAVVELDTARTLALIGEISKQNAAIGGALESIAKRLDYARLLRLLDIPQSGSAATPGEEAHV